MCEGKSSSMERFLCILEDKSSLASINNPKCFLSNFCFFLVLQEGHVFLHSYELPRNALLHSCPDEWNHFGFHTERCLLFWSTREVWAHEGGLGTRRAWAGDCSRSSAQYDGCKVLNVMMMDDTGAWVSRAQGGTGTAGLSREGQWQLLHRAALSSACPRGAPGGCQPVPAVVTSSVCHLLSQLGAPNHGTCAAARTLSAIMQLSRAQRTHSSHSVYRDWFFTQFQLFFFHRMAWRYFLHQVCALTYVTMTISH